MEKEIYFLAIETSCDDTSVSVLRAKEDKRGKLKKIEAISNIVSSQTELHAGYGGVYPFLAKREHQKNLPVVFEQSGEKFRCFQDKIHWRDQGPGTGSLFVDGNKFCAKPGKEMRFAAGGRQSSGGAFFGESC